MRARRTSFPNIKHDQKSFYWKTRPDGEKLPFELPLAQQKFDIFIYYLINCVRRMLHLRRVPHSHIQIVSRRQAHILYYIRMQLIDHIIAHTSERWI